jgi:hypothetical protein
LLTRDAKVRLSLRSVVEAEDSFDVADEFIGEMNAALANAIGYAVEGLIHELYSEGLLHGGDAAGELHDAPLRCGRSGFHLEAELTGKRAYELDGSRVGAMVSAILSSRQPFFAEFVCGLERLLATDQE